jgi:hypothetical protein
MAAPVPDIAPPATSDTVAARRRAVTDEDIRLRAYFLSLERGGQGSAVDFWLLAERELRGARDTQ